MGYRSRTAHSGIHRCSCCTASLTSGLCAAESWVSAYSKDCGLEPHTVAWMRLRNGDRAGWAAVLWRDGVSAPRESLPKKKKENRLVGLKEGGKKLQVAERISNGTLKP
ncbi:hypothetical protein H920_15208 [Fukomys damarensis]|uniref:Uncharacterized protein n=1 Tax=Fukomys damarensis TaxID=885580 RepID=A0A091CYX4_FUKDA|nr:hypothetical protein H920_15208 [Fukomys damarensis]